MPLRGNRALPSLFSSRFHVAVRLSVGSSLFLTWDLRFPVFVLAFTIIGEGLVARCRVSCRRVEGRVTGKARESFPGDRNDRRSFKLTRQQAAW